LSGVPSADPHFTPTHVRIDVRHAPTTKRYILSVNAVERKDNGIESCLLLGDPARSYYGILGNAPRYSAKELAAWARVLDTAIQAEKTFIWERIVAVVQAHGASIAK
jgi:hypothetical protein